jgi:hypothetical protein
MNTARLKTSPLMEAAALKRTDDTDVTDGADQEVALVPEAPGVTETG